ncbi:hypothetical protein FK220_014600 [Flavobacteriaceae bacterium TP-CH-4]|uniref:DUF4136 domain-containing protein n=1 Tax=Pelagihabitans pacificus TaxID=2696054 RepID=A0A967AZW1_9FLAO|nr:hypothetical protein [Pelagihabitans pacificus]NHF60582.1 hypothetical protein [Pelagihabitans pacificus]
MKKLITLCTFLACFAVQAQKMKVEQGGFDFIKGQKEINVEFVYDNMRLMKDNLTNEEYVTNRSADLEEKARGKGKTWEKAWESSPTLIWQPKFLELINKYLGNEQDIYFAEDLSDTPYTLIVETVWLYPGWDAGIMKQPAKVTTNLKFVETSNKDTILLEVSSKNAPGDQWGNNYSNESRVGEGYAKTAKSLAKLISKKAF